MAALLSIAVLAFAPALGLRLAASLTGTSIATATGTALAYGLTAAIGAIGMLVVNALFPPRLPEIQDQGQAIKQYSLSGGSNRARPYLPLLLPLGEHRVFPDVAMIEYYEYDETGDQYLNMLFDFGIGDMDFSDFRIGETLLSDYDDVETQIDVDTIDLVYRNVNTIAGGDLDTYNTYVSRRSQTGITRIGVDLIGQYFRVADDGAIDGRQIDFQIGYKLASASSWTNNTESLSSPDGVDARNPVRKSFYYDVAAGQYDVRVRRTTDWSTTSRRVTASALYASLKGFEPNEADFSGRNPYAMRIKATGQLHGRVDRLSALVNHKVPTWDGDAWTDNQATSNPAWIYYKVLRGWWNGNILLAGMGLPDARIDLEAIKDWGEFCTDNDLEFNFVLDRNMTPDKLLELIGQCGYGSPSRSTGKLGIVWEDQDEPVSAVFSPANIKAGSLEIAYHNEHLADEIIGTFYDKDSGYEENQIRRNVPTVNNPRNPINIKLDGISNGDQAAKELNRTAATQVYHPRTINWSTSEEGWKVTRGAVAGLSHGLVGGSLGGRLIAAESTALVTLSVEPEVSSTDTDYIWLWLVDGSVHTSEYSIESGKQIRLATALDTIPDEPFAVKFLTFAGDSDSIKVRITGVEPDRDGGFSYTARDDTASYYDAITSDLTAELIRNRPRLFQITDLLITDFQQLIDGAEVTMISVKLIHNGVGELHGANIKADGVFVGVAATSEELVFSSPVRPGLSVEIVAIPNSDYGLTITKSYLVSGDVDRARRTC